MTPGAWRPKRWLRPRSRRWREARDENGRPLTASEILKTMYSDGWEPPKWAREAYKHGWITLVRLCRLDSDEWIETPARKFRNAMFADSALMRMLRKDWS